MNRYVKWLRCRPGLRGQSTPTTTSSWHKQLMTIALLTDELPLALPSPTQEEALGRAPSRVPRCSVSFSCGGVRRPMLDCGLCASVTPSSSLSAPKRAATTGPQTLSVGDDQIRLATNALLAEASQLLDTPVRQLAATRSAAAIAPTERTSTEHPFTEAHASWTYATQLRDVVSPAELTRVKNRAILDVDLATWAKEKDALEQHYGADFLLVSSSARRAEVLVASSARRAEEAAEVEKLPFSSYGLTVRQFVTHLMKNDFAVDFPRLQELVQAHCKVLAVKFLDLAATLPAVGDSKFLLTSREAPFCGSDRESIIDCMIETTKNTDDWKEAKPIHFVVGAPRLGKSRVLTEYVLRVRNELLDVRVIQITFNSETPIEATKVLRTESDVRWQVLSRVFRSLMKEHLPLACGIWEIGGALSWDDMYHHFVRKGSNERPPKVVLVADELSKLVDQFEASRSPNLMSAVTSSVFSNSGLLFASGFLKEDGRALETLSGRPVVRHYLAPVQASTSDSYDELRQLAKKACTAGLYNQIRFVPGLMGLAVEMAKAKSGEKQSALSPPLLGVLSRMHQDQKQKTQLEVLAETYLTHVAAKTDARTFLELSSEVDKALDKWGVLMRYGQQIDAATFVPYYLLHGAGGQHLLSPFKLLLDSDLTDITARGKYLEALVLVALRLRAKYSSPMHVRDLVRLLGGRSLLSVGNGKVDGELVTLGNDNLDAEGNARKSFPPFVSFPCHTETKDRIDFPRSRRRSRPAADIKRNKANAMAAVSGFERFVAQPTAEFNKGCDTVQVATLRFDGKPAKMVLLFETRFWQNERLFSSQDVGEKALFCLIGLLANYRGVFRRAAFVYLTTAGDTPSINEDDLRLTKCSKKFSIHAEVAAIQDYLRKEKKGAALSDHPTLGQLVDVANKVDPNLTFTVHVVACPGGTKEDASPEFQSCMMGSLTYLCPDFELVKPRNGQ